MNIENVQFDFPLLSGSYKFNTFWIIDANVRSRIGGVVEYLNTKKRNKP